MLIIMSFSTSGREAHNLRKRCTTLGGDVRYTLGWLFQTAGPLVKWKIVRQALEPFTKQFGST
jgi:hypothetical protein